MTWWIPLRSLLRNRRRTLLSVAIIALGTAISLFVFGFLEDSRLQIQATTVDEYGNLQIASPDLWDDTTEDYNYLITPETEAQIRQLLGRRDKITGITSQLQFPGLIAAGNQTQVVRITSQVPENDTLNIDAFVIAGRPLRTSDVASVLMGRSLANRLGLTVDDVVTLTLTTVDGAYNATPLRIVGIYRFTSEQVELRSLFMPVAFAQRLLNTSGVDRLIINLESISATNSEAASIQRLLDDAALSFEVRTWDDLSPFYKQLSGFFDILFGFLTLAVFILVFFIILQVLTLAFLERTREIGTIRALGTTRGEVLGQLLLESGWLAVIGSVTGVLLGFALSLGFNALGIQWQPPGTVETSVLSVQIGLLIALPPFGVSVVATLLSAIFPAIQTSRLRVVDALRVE
ncbi:ABC transporter permease [Candidatus Bipolaricaulota bacterium]|nr:ABC transporter permease [Candidatus Bipolaricaulota bacterium]TFH10583.1 MAG: ABC transporter permease [Candidatus Atribacteria bacterium]